MRQAEDIGQELSQQCVNKKKPLDGTGTETIYEGQAENQRTSMRIYHEVLNSIDHIMTTSTRDSECVSVSV